MTTFKLVIRAVNSSDCYKTVLIHCGRMQHEVKFYRICRGAFCSGVNGPYSSPRLAARASALAHCQALVHYKVFSLLIGGL